MRESSVDSLTGYHTPHATSRVLHVALTTRDQVYVGVADSLPGSIAAVHADVEPLTEASFFLISTRTASSS